MPLDLFTLLVLRLCVDLLIAIAFGAMARRYAGIGGPGWWSLGSLLSMVGTFGMVFRVEGGGPELAAMAATFMLGGVVCAWLGLRAYLGMTLPMIRAVGLLSIIAVLHFFVASGHDRPAVHQSLFAAASLLIALWSLCDIRSARQRRRQPEWMALSWLIVVEFLALLALLLWVLYHMGSADRVAAVFLFAFLVSKMMRAVLYGALVSLRLHRDAEQARNAAARRDAQSRALVDNLGAGVVVLQADRRVVTINEAARRFFGFDGAADGSALLSLKGHALLREDGSPMPRHETPFEQVLALARPVSDVVIGLHACDSDDVRWALCNAYPENDSLGGLRHVVSTFVDITSLRQAQQHQHQLAEQLSQSQKMEALGTLAGGVAHDFNNILAAILGNAHLARQDMVDSAPARESLHEISNAARRGRELVRQILAFSRRQPLERTAISLDTVVGETSSLLRTALTPRIQLIVHTCPDCPAVKADPTQIGQVLLNLGTNAIHALQGQPGRIELSVQAVAADDPALPPEVAHQCQADGVDAVSILVSDTGCGMDEATRQRIFEPFFTTKPVGKGTGLGLPVVLGIVQAHGGAIRVESAPGQGARFTLFFPAAAVATSFANAGTMEPAPDAEPMPDVSPHEERSPMTTTPAASAGHVLYLDDDDTLVFLVRRLLQRRGYQVSAFCDQKEAIEAVKANPQGFDLLLTDYNMPGMSGIDVAREVLAINPQLSVAVASGYINEELEQKAAEVGVREVVFKTDAIESFCEVVQRLVQPRAA